MQTNCKPCLTIQAVYKAMKQYLYAVWQYYIEPQLFRRLSSYRERYKIRSRLHMLNKNTKNFTPLNPVIDTLYGSSIRTGIGYHRFKTKQEARAAVRAALSPYKPTWKKFKQALEESSRINQYVCTISNQAAVQKARTNQGKVAWFDSEEACDEAIKKIRKFYSSSDRPARDKTDREKFEEALKTADINQIIHVDTLTTQIPPAKKVHKHGKK